MSELSDRGRELAATATPSFDALTQWYADALELVPLMADEIDRLTVELEAEKGATSLLSSGTLRLVEESQALREQLGTAREAFDYLAEFADGYAGNGEALKRVVADARRAFLALPEVTT